MAAAEPRTSERAPDYIEPIVAYRKWQLDEDNSGRLILRSNTRWSPWWPGRDFQADCLRDEEVPAEGCKCGVYAAAADEQLDGMDYLDKFAVRGQVGLIGKVIEHESGYRAERARPLKLTVDVSLTKFSPERILAELAAYGCPVEIIDTSKVKRARPRLTRRRALQLLMTTLWVAGTILFVVVIIAGFAWFARDNSAVKADRLLEQAENSYFAQHGHYTDALPSVLLPVSPALKAELAGNNAPVAAIEEIANNRLVISFTTSHNGRRVFSILSNGHLWSRSCHVHPGDSCRSVSRG